MIKTTLFLPDKILLGGNELIDTWHIEPDSVIWVDLSRNEISEEAEFLKQQFAIHPLAIQDSQRNRHPPKIELFDQYTFILLKGLSIESVTIDFKTIQLAFFIADRFVITRHSGESTSIQRLEDEIRNDDSLYFTSGSQLALRLCRLMAERYLTILLNLETRLEELEELMLSNPDDKLLAELIGYKSDLKRMNRFATYHEQIFKNLKDKKHPKFDNEDRNHEIIDVWEQHERIQSLSLLYYETASDLIDGYISVASHRLNQIMKFLTVVMAIFVPLSFLAGIYGMNFENMPELHTKSGYFILLTIMTALATILLIIFRRIKWL
ncbi:MAG: magnesium/cobalt transporter CorA [Gammaproteobacteria bacterium]|nr:magnesium/cobalt transporter CorA [Gammaproteobacteria bacterium]